MTRPGIVSIHHLALRTVDVARLERFYGGLLGLSAVRRDAVRGSVWLRVGESVLMLEPAGPGEPAIDLATRELLAFAVDDRESWRSRLNEAGVDVEDETGHTLYFRDPDGRRVAVSSYPLFGMSPEP
jgi:catechol 2,3-dioxygenase-like lactoylglutathione lyase family enzyme